MNSASPISACLVVYNEEAVIERCLTSIADLVNEIILVHDGPCSDKTLEIAERLGARVFVREHWGIAEPHRSFTFELVKSEWILQIDADEYVDTNDIPVILSMVASRTTDAYQFRWEFWNGMKTIYFSGLQKVCLFKKDAVTFSGVPQAAVLVKGTTKATDLYLHHRPSYNNIAWRSFLKKMKRWVPVHAQFFFPHTVPIMCFNTTADAWEQYAEKVKEHIYRYLVFAPLKMALGQLKNGLWTSWYGLNAVAQQYVYYFYLYSLVWQMKRKKS